MRERLYQKLIVWKEAHALCVHIYSMTKNFPSEEKFCLVNQMRRSSYSIPMNIAEGNAKRSKKDHAHFIETSIGSLEELHYQCILAHSLQYIDGETLEKSDSMIQKVGYLLNKLHSSLL